MACPLIGATPMYDVVADFFSARNQALPFDMFVVKKVGGGSSAQNKGIALTQGKQRHVLMIFVHGTLFPFPSFSAVQEWAGEVFKNNATATDYMRIMRDHGFLRYQPIGPLGLHPVGSAVAEGSTSAQVLTWFLQEMYNVLSPGQGQIVVHGFTFGWDGLLSSDRRKMQSYDLYSSLGKLVADFKRNVACDELEVVILAHSHGGNVALHMADWFNEVPSFFVDDLITFGVPIDAELQAKALSPIFKNVSNFHSNGDFVQIADVISTKKYVPARVYKDAKITESPRIKQVQIEVADFLPNHGELWFFGKSDSIFFRQNFPIAPLPVAAFTPLILHELRKVAPSEHYLKLKLDVNKEKIHVALIPFLDYSSNKLIQLHQYQDQFDFSALSRKLPRILNE